MMPVAPLTHHLGAADRSALEAHFLALGPEDRRLRFGTFLKDDGVREYVARIDFVRDEVFVVRDNELAILGAVHVALTGDAAELGLSVLPQSRGQGVGNALFERAVMHLRNHGAQSVFVHCLSENQAMMHLARKHGMRLGYDGSESDALVELRPATAESHLAEWVHEQHAEAVQAMRENTLIARRFLAFFAPRRQG